MRGIKTELEINKNHHQLFLLILFGWNNFESFQVKIFFFVGDNLHIAKV